MKDKIIKNLYLKVDYQKKSDQGILFNNAKLFLVGILPVFITYRNGKKEIAKLQTKEEITTSDPKLKELFGKNNDQKSKEYQASILNMARKFENILNRILSNKEFNKKPISDLVLVKL